jgi:hypothetical protein
MTVNYNRPQINVNEKLNTNKTNIGQLGRKVLGAQTQEQLSDYVGAGRINQIRNGDATINQRGESSYSANGYTLDGWFMGSATTYTVTPHTLSTPFKGFNKALRCQVTGSGNTDPYLLQRIENGHVVFHQQTVTFSFWATGDVEMALASQGVSFPGGYGTVPFKDLVQIDEFRGGWRRFAATVGMGDLSGLSYFQIGFEMEPSTVFDVYFTGIQCEIGSNASPFQHIPIQEQLAWNQRYYYRVSTSETNATIGTGFNTSTTGARGIIPFPVNMRVAPTGIEQTGAATNYKIAHAAISTVCSAVPTFANASNAMCGVNFTVASGLTVGQGIAIERNSGTAYIGFTGAEL